MEQLNLLTSAKAQKIYEQSRKINELIQVLREDRLNSSNYYWNEYLKIKEYKLSDKIKALIFQNKMQQPDVVIAHIKAFGFITNKECNDIYGYRHLPSIIQKIEKRNYVVKTRPIENAVDRFKLPVAPVEYFFAEDATITYFQKFQEKMGA